MSSNATVALPTAQDPPRPRLRSVYTPVLPAAAARPAETFLSRAESAGLPVTGPLEFCGLVVDLGGYSVTADGKELDLSPRQVELLALFLAWPRRVWSRKELHEICWGMTSSPSRRVDVQLCRLRSRTGLDLFRNVRDRGWALRAGA